MSVMKYKDPVTGEVKKVGSPVNNITAENIVVSEEDDGKVLMVVNGKATWVKINNAEGAIF